MQNNPYDDLLKNLAHLLEQLTTLDRMIQPEKNPDAEKPHIFGCAIIAGAKFPFEGAGRGNNASRNSRELSYEMTDAGEKAYLTLELAIPEGVKPEVSFSEESCNISVSGISGKIGLPFEIQPDECCWSYRNGILDALLIKSLSSSDAEPVSD